MQDNFLMGVKHIKERKRKKLTQREFNKILEEEYIIVEPALEKR